MLRQSCFMMNNKESIRVAIVLLLAVFAAFHAYGQNIKWKIPPQYDEAYEFRQGCAVVGNDKPGSEWTVLGVINEQGKQVLPLEYTDIRYGCNQVFWVSDAAHSNRKYQLVNRKNEVLVPFKYDDVKPAGTRYAVGYLRSGSDQEVVSLLDNEDSGPDMEVLLDSLGREITKPDARRSYEILSDSTIFISDGEGDRELFNLRTGKRIPCVWCHSILESEGGKYLVRHDSAYYLINQDGVTEHAYPFLYIQEGFHGGLARIMDYRLGTFGLIDESGKVMLPLRRQEISDFRFGTALLYSYSEGECSILDTRLRTLFSVPRDSVEFIQKQGNVYYCRKDFKAFIINEKMERVPLVENLQFCRATINGIIVKDRETQKFGLLNTAGQTILPAVFDDLKIQNSCRTLLAAEYQGKYGYIDLKDYQ